MKLALYEVFGWCLCCGWWVRRSPEQMVVGLVQKVRLIFIRRADLCRDVFKHPTNLTQSSPLHIEHMQKFQNKTKAVFSRLAAEAFSSLGLQLDEQKNILTKLRCLGLDDEDRCGRFQSRSVIWGICCGDENHKCWRKTTSGLLIFDNTFCSTWHQLVKGMIGKLMINVLSSFSFNQRSSKLIKLATLSHFTRVLWQCCYIHRFTLTFTC